MPGVGSLLFAESTNSRNRYAKIICNYAGGTIWNISINGTDNNGNKVKPKFCTIDNYQSTSAVYYSLDGITGSVAPYSKITLEISLDANVLQITLGTGSAIIWFSEQKLPLNDGSKYQVTPVTLTIALTGSGNWTVPETWNAANNKIHCIGAGGVGINSPGQRGGGGGAYARKENTALVIGTVIPYVAALTNIGVDTTFNGAGFLKAQSAAMASNLGGTAAASVGDFKTSGGNGGAGPGSAALGGGGAGGPNASGNAPANGFGGSADGGLGGAGATIFSGNGVAGKTWTRTNDGVQFGPGGGGAASDGTATLGSNGGKYGGGAGGSDVASPPGAGENGVIVIEWTP